MTENSEQQPTLMACIEAIVNSSERLRTLRNLTFQTSDGYIPNILSTSHYYRIKAEMDSRPQVIYIPRQLDMIRQAQIYMACDVTRASQAGVLAKARYFRRELLLMYNQEPIYTDIIIEEGGDTLRDQLNRYALKHDRDPIRKLIKEMTSLTQRLHNSSIIHGRITPDNIYTDSSRLTMLLGGYPMVQSRSAGADNQILLTIATALYIIGSSPLAYQRSGGVELFIPHMLTGLLPLIETWQSPMARRMLELFQAIRKGNLTNKHTEQLLGILSDMPFDDTMAVILQEHHQQIKGDIIRIIHPKMAEVPPKPQATSEQNQGLVDFASCEVVCTMCEMLIRFMRDGKWGYADRKGHPLPLPPLVEAGEFYEGRAAVCTTDGWGLIDSEGRFVMEAKYEELYWHREYNVVTARIAGRWSLFNRSGQQIISTHYDHIGRCSEGFFSVSRSGKYSFINTEGRQLTDLRYDEVFDFKNGRALVFCDGISHHINTSGKRVD